MAQTIVWSVVDSKDAVLKSAYPDSNFNETLLNIGTAASGKVKATVGVETSPPAVVQLFVPSYLFQVVPVSVQAAWVILAKVASLEPALLLPC